MKKYIRFVGGLLLLVLAIWVYKVRVVPVRYALKPSDLKNLQTLYFLVEWTQVTVSSWMVVGDQNGYYEQAKCVIIDGEDPSMVENYAVATGDNTCICYGEYIEERYLSEVQETLSDYRSTGWTVLYPVKRDGLLPFMPKNYLRALDFP
jgi:hypothetical protein